MSDRGPSDHWAELGSILGADPLPSDKEAKAAPNAPESAAEVSVPTPVAPPRSQPRSAPKRKPADWGQLAGELGITPPPAPPAPSPAPPAPAPVKSASPAELMRGTPPSQPVEVDVDVARFDEEAGVELPGFEELADEFDDETSSLIDESDVLDEPEGPSPTEAEAAEEAAERRGRSRRRRRRRPRKPADAESSETLEAEVQDAELAAPFELSTPVGDLDQPESADVAPDVSSEASTRSKRRRRRRGSGRGKKAAEQLRDQSPEAEAVEDDDLLDDEMLPVYDAVPGESDLDASDIDASDMDEPDMDDSDVENKPAHRGIPTWRETVDLVISANLESRAKRPSGKPSSRQRSGRRPPRREKPANH